MPTIVLNRNTTNPDIPRVPVPGFEDSFNRADSGLLGETPGGKLWAVDVGSWRVESGQAAFDATKAYSYATVDALAVDGTLEVTMGELHEGTAAAGGMVLRWTDSNNFIRAYFRNGGKNVVGLTHYKNGEATSTWAVASTREVVKGSVVKAVMDGPRITVSVDGDVVMSATTPVLTGTRHGLVGVGAGAGTRFDTIKFTPAG